MNDQLPGTVRVHKPLLLKDIPWLVVKFVVIHIWLAITNLLLYLPRLILRIPFNTLRWRRTTFNHYQTRDIIEEWLAPLLLGAVVIFVVFITGLLPSLDGVLLGALYIALFGVLFSCGRIIVLNEELRDSQPGRKP